MGATAGIALMGLGAGMQASAYKATGESQAALANYNAQLGQLKAQDAIARGEVAVDKQHILGRKVIGSQRAAFAASGVDITDPDSTAVNTFADTAATSEMDALTIRTNAAREAWGYRMQAQNDQALGEIAKAEGSNKAIGSYLSAGANVLYGKYGFGSTTRGRNA